MNIGLSVVAAASLMPSQYDDEWVFLHCRFLGGPGKPLALAAAPAAADTRGLCKC